MLKLTYHSDGALTLKGRVFVDYDDKPGEWKKVYEKALTPEWHTWLLNLTKNTASKYDITVCTYYEKGTFPRVSPSAQKNPLELSWH